MYLKAPITNLLQQLQQVLEALSDQQYTVPVALMSNSSLGQHVRHIIEFYLELHHGYLYGTVNYDKRKRDEAIASNRLFAIKKLDEIRVGLARSDKQLFLAASYSTTDQEEITVSTNYYRELVYNLEHTVHHMALMRIAIATVSDLQLPADFGLAISTLKFRQSCAQ